MAPLDGLDEHRLARLIDAGRGLMSELDLETVLDRLLQTAADLTGARYVALGVLDEGRRELARFLTRGIDEDTHRAIGDLPRGRGILGVLIDDPRPLRLDDVGDHPRSYGFPPGHPPMRSFLGVPILIRGEAWGNLYLTEKAGGEPFALDDEEAVIVLADWAAIAIENAGLYREVTVRREELERAVRGLQATAAIARAIGGETELDRILELVVKRGRALMEAHDVLIMLREGDELVIAAGAGHVQIANTARLPLAGSTAGQVLAEGRSRRIADAARELLIPPDQLGLDHASTALLVPLVYRGQSLGVLAAFDRLDGDGAFTRDDEQLLEAFAAQAATAVATAKSVEADRRRRSLAATEAERHRWARELHDETLQALGGLKVLLSSATQTRRRRRHARSHARGDAAADRRHRVAACAHRRAAPAGPRSARTGARARVPGAAHGSGERRRGPRGRRAARGQSPGARGRDDRLSRGPGVAHQRRQARPRLLGRHRRSAARATRWRCPWPMTASASTPRPRQGTASDWPACASVSSSPAGSSACCAAPTPERSSGRGSHSSERNYPALTKPWSSA